MHCDTLLQLNQLDALISQIHFWNGTQHVSDRYSVHHQESSTVHTVIGICRTGFGDCLLAGSGWNRPDLASKLMMDRETVGNMLSSILKMNLRD